MIEIEKVNLQVLSKTADYSRLEAKLKLNKAMMDDLEANGLKDLTDDNGINRYKKTEMIYWETFDKMNAL